MDESSSESDIELENQSSERPKSSKCDGITTILTTIKQLIKANAKRANLKFPADFLPTWKGICKGSTYLFIISTKKHGKNQ